MTIRVMSSGKGYECLLSLVVVGDGDRERSSSLTRYYTEPPSERIAARIARLKSGFRGEVTSLAARPSPI